MGVYIKDEKMPDTCTECFKHNKCDRYHIEILKTEDGDYIPQYIADNCPLIEVKAPHGRLIDADREIKEITEIIESNSLTEKAWNEYDFFRRILKTAPTVIEAEVE